MMKRLFEIIVIVLVMLGILSGCMQSDYKNLVNVESLIKSGQWEEGEKLLETTRQPHSSLYKNIEASITHKKEADKHYTNKRYADAFIEYDQMPIKDELVVTRSKNLAQYRVDDLKKKIFKSQQTGLCHDIESIISKIKEIANSHPYVKYSPAKLEQQLKDCFLHSKAMSSVEIGDYSEALSYFEQVENYSTNAVVLYILALQSEDIAYYSTMKKFLYRIPADYNGPYYKEILSYKKKYIPKNQWKQQYSKYHKLAFTAYEKAVFTSTITNKSSYINKKQENKQISTNKGRSNSGYKVNSSTNSNKGSQSKSSNSTNRTNGSTSSSSKGSSGSKSSSGSSYKGSSSNSGSTSSRSYSSGSSSRGGYSGGYSSGGGSRGGGGRR
ncbi:hypothetical protein [Paenibacillus agilis]|uniref:Lipoprotein n=1 Tax=Paenibacillus agilis TaxID=3020863 RepID=A0A559IGM8_9BACL|nr:hypothetical protein [Paenibacillus agilis]TVX86791.1 hypothetical protein FPZ44_22995 [Paenibacillus agilis]